MLLAAHVVVFLTAFTPTVEGQTFERVKFFTDSVWEKSGTYMRLVGGSSWLLVEPSLALPTDDVIIVFRMVLLRGGTQVMVTTAYFDGEETTVRHVGGKVVVAPGYLTRVIRVHGDGAVLELANGMLLSVPEYDRYHTGWWLPPYKALLTGNMLYLYNLKNLKRVWVTPIR
jgi:hypothetical protein